MFVSIVFLIFCTSAYAKIVHLPVYGSVDGAEEKSRDRTNFHAFRGIQYGKATTGNLRFREPQKPDPWGARDAKKFGNKCPQVHPLDPEKSVIGSEDCLYLNVYTPTLDPEAKLPVVIWFHGGGFAVGSSDTYEPHYFMDEPIILVTFNYRLNALGFMHYDDNLLSGNYGMKDQVAVLEWVRDYIRLFGGDPTRVTLAGSSSGAAAINWHMYSRRSEKLFHRAICQSGTARSMWAQIPRHVAKQRAIGIAAMAGCTYKSIEENVKCLRRISMEELIQFQSRFDIWRGNPFYFGVVIELPNSEMPFITVSPWNSKPLSNIPLMIGYTSDEGGLTASGLLANHGEAINELGRKFERLFPVLMLYQVNMGLETEEAVFKVTKDIRQQYFEQEEININTFPLIKNMLGDSQIIYDTLHTIRNYESTKYFYIYSHKNQHSFADLEPNPMRGKTGAVHSDDLISLFKLQSIFPSVKELNPVDLKVSKVMIKLWSSFIIHGDPNLESKNKYKWNPVQNEIYFYSIAAEPLFEKMAYDTVYSFWEGLGWHADT